MTRALPQTLAIPARPRDGRSPLPAVGRRGNPIHGLLWAIPLGCAFWATVGLLVWLGSGVPGWVAEARACGEMGVECVEGIGR